MCNSWEDVCNLMAARALENSGKSWEDLVTEEEEACQCTFCSSMYYGWIWGKTAACRKVLMKTEQLWTDHLNHHLSHLNILKMVQSRLFLVENHNKQLSRQRVIENTKEEIRIARDALVKINRHGDDDEEEGWETETEYYE